MKPPAHDDRHEQRGLWWLLLAAWPLLLIGLAVRMGADLDAAGAALLYIVAQGCMAGFLYFDRKLPR